MKGLVDRVCSVDAAWRISGFAIDDPAFEIDPGILFCLWQIRRSWLRNVIKRRNNIEVQLKVFKHMGKLVHSIWSNIDPYNALEEVFQDFVDQTSFVQYFKGCWVPKLEMWLSTMRSLPLASQEMCGAMEGYHVKLKLQRVDWLVHKLTTELHSSYWLYQYADGSGSKCERGVHIIYFMAQSITNSR